MQQKRASLWNLFSVFFRIGAFTFGGGLAMLPLIEREVVEVQGWVEQEEILDIVALSQSVPGAIAVNSAIFIGLRLRGLAGALAALLGVMTPSVVIILIIAHFFTQFQSNPYVMRAFSGVKAAVIGLVPRHWRVGRQVVTSPTHWPPIGRPDFERLDSAHRLLSF